MSLCFGCSLTLGSDTDPLDTSLLARVCFCFHPVALMARDGFLCALREREKEREEGKKKNRRGTREEEKTIDSRELKVAENPKLLDLRDHTVFSSSSSSPLSFFPAILTLFFFFSLRFVRSFPSLLFLSGKAQQPQHAVYFGVVFFLFPFIGVFRSVKPAYGPSGFFFFFFFLVCVNRTDECYVLFLLHGTWHRRTNGRLILYASPPSTSCSLGKKEKLTFFLFFLCFCCRAPCTHTHTHTHT